MNPIQQVDLSGMWRFKPENGEAVTIEAPGGGWLKQGFDCEAAVYERHIEIPRVLVGQVTHLVMGAVNHLARVYIGKEEGSLIQIHEEVTAFTPQVADLTPHVVPGETYLLRIFVRAFENGRPIAPHWAEWCESIARGLFRGLSLAIYPPVYIADAFVRTHVTGTGQDRLEGDVWVTNATDEPKLVTLRAALRPCGDAVWNYPQLPQMRVEVGAHETRRVALEPVAWPLGPGSFWRPNVPYGEGYRAQLHRIEWTATTDVTEHTAEVRFGFREMRQVGDHFELNGARINFRGDNLQVANYDRIDHNGRGDAIGTLPGFLPPTPQNPGWPQAVDNFLRLNYNVQRQHMGPWTPYMLDVCDELGLMLLGESACRWDGFDMENGRGAHEAKCLADIVRRDRNHPCIVRWSTKNETQCLDPQYHVELYEAVKALDPTRPIYEDILIGNREEFIPEKVFAPLLDRGDFTWIEHYLTADDEGRPYFTAMAHNDISVPMLDRPFGIGEADWMRSSTPAAAVWFASTVAMLRAQGASDVRPYTLLSYWASCIPGVLTTDLLTEENRHPVYGEDNLPDPWSLPGIQLLQRAYHPLLAMDYDFWRANRLSDAHGHYPTVSPQLEANAPVSRSITVFNDDLAGEELELRWELREGSPSNRVFQRGGATLRIKPGRQAKTEVAFRAPQFNTFLFLRLSVWKEGAVRFVDDMTCFEVVGGEDFRSEFNGEEREFK